MPEPMESFPIYKLINAVDNDFEIMRGAIEEFPADLHEAMLAMQPEDRIDVPVSYEPYKAGTHIVRVSVKAEPWVNSDVQWLDLSNSVLGKKK